MSQSLDLKEETNFLDKFFPFNIFLNKAEYHNVLYPHWHESIEIIYMLKGSAVFNFGNQTINASSGDVLFVNSGLLHSGYSVDNTYVEFYAVVIDKSLLRSQSPDPYHLKYVTPFIEGKYLFPNKITAGDSFYSSIQAYINLILNEFDIKNYGFELNIKAYLNLLIVSILRNCSPSEFKEVHQEKYTREIERFKNLFPYIEQNYNRKITVKEASNLVNLSSHHFCKTFKKVTGRTFIEFLNLYRVNLAEDMLRKTSLPITEISEKVGFCNINYFDKTFKQYKRYPPSKCRK